MERWRLYDREMRDTGLVIDETEEIPEGLYHAAADVWIRNSEGKYLLGRRSSIFTMGPLYLAPLHGTALSTESSFLTAYRKVQETLGINIPADAGKVVKTVFLHDPDHGTVQEMRDVWIFECDVTPHLEKAPKKEFESTSWYTAEEVAALIKIGEVDPSFTYFEEVIAPVPNFAVKRLGYKTVSDSVTELSRGLRYPDINGQNRLFGGKLLEMIDEIGGVTAMRHAGCNVTTVSIEHLEFKKGAFLNDTIVMIARVTHVGRTSIEVRIDTWLEDLPTGRRTIINRAFFTEVCINDEGRPIPVPYGLILESESEKARWEGAEKRVQQRKKAQREGY